MSASNTPASSLQWRRDMALNKNGAAAALRLPGVRTKGDVVAGRYRVETILGRGSSGFVVAARHVQLRHGVRLKILTSATRAQQKAQRKYLAQAHRAATLQGPYSVRILDTGVTEDGDAFIASEPLDGKSLADELKQRTRVSVDEAVRWTLQACEAVGEAHAQGFHHGDLKPENLFLVPSAHGDRTVKVVDFGMSSLLDEGSPAFFTSPAYLAPEQIQDPERVNARADVWALGVILHHAVAGSLPFAGSTVSAMLVAVAYDEPEPLAGVSPALAALVRRCLAKNPAERPADAYELARLLARVDSVEADVPAVSSSDAPLAMVVDQTPSALKTAPYPLVMHSEPVPVAPLRDVPAVASVVSVTPPRPRLPSLADISELGVSRDANVGSRRRRGALVAACAAGVLVVVGFAFPAREEARGRLPTLSDDEPMSLTREPDDAPVFVPPSFRLHEKPSSRGLTDALGRPDAPAAIAVPTTTMPSSVPMPPSQIDAAFGPATANVFRAAGSSSRRPSVVRDDPSAGGTHPSRAAAGGR